MIFDIDLQVIVVAPRDEAYFCISPLSVDGIKHDDFAKTDVDQYF